MNVLLLLVGKCDGESGVIINYKRERMGNTEVYVCSILRTNGSNKWWWKTVIRCKTIRKVKRKL